jgi:hypothetical protein
LSICVLCFKHTHMIFESISIGVAGRRETKTIRLTSIPFRHLD